jgi:hypothetical protein
MVEHALGRNYDVAAVCHKNSVEKLKDHKDRITIIPGLTNDPDLIQRAVNGCDGVPPEYE